MLSEAFRTAFEEGLADINADVVDLFGIVAPIALGIAGFKLALNLGMSLFRSIAR